MSKIKQCILIILAVVLAISLNGCKSKIMSQGPITDANDLEGRVVGVTVAWDADYLLTGREDLKLKRYDTPSDCAMALRYAQIDAMAADIASATDICNKVSGLKISDVPLTSEGFCVMVNKDQTKLFEEINDFCSRFRETEECKQLQYILHNINEFPHIEPVKATGTGPVIKVKVDEIYYPMTYYDTVYKKYCGVEVDFLTYFANEYNYQLEITGGTYETMAMNIATGLADIGVGGVSEIYRTTIEESGMMLLTQSYIDMDIVFIEVEDFDNININSNLE